MTCVLPIGEAMANAIAKIFRPDFAQGFWPNNKFFWQRLRLYSVPCTEQIGMFFCLIFGKSFYFTLPTGSDGPAPR